MYDLMRKNGQTNLLAKFERFLQNIELPTSLCEDINHQFIRLNSNVLQYFPFIERARLAGSFSRNTMIKRDKTVDILLFLDPLYVDITPNSLLNKLQHDLQCHFGQNQICQSRAAVVINMEHCVFELLPIVYKDSHYFMAVTGGQQWQMVCDPLILAQKLVVADSQYQGYFTRMIKIMKIWQRKYQISGLASFELEEQIIDCLNGNEGVRQGLEKLLAFYGWHDESKTRRDIEHMDEVQFAQYCHQTLFGEDFPT